MLLSEVYWLTPQSKMHKIYLIATAITQKEIKSKLLSFKVPELFPEPPRNIVLQS